MKHRHRALSLVPPLFAALLCVEVAMAESEGKDAPSTESTEISAPPAAAPPKAGVESPDTRTAAARTEDARRDGHEGLAAYERSDWDSAYDAFTRAEASMHSPVFLLYAARCQVELGHLPEARGLYTGVLREDLDGGAPPAWLEARKSAETELGALEARLDQLALPIAEPVPVTEQTAPGSSKPHAPEPPSKTPSAAPLEPLAAAGLRPTRQAAVVAFGVAGVGLLAGLITGGLAVAKADESKQGCSGNSCPPENEDTRNQALELADWATGSFIVAGVGAAAGATLWFWPSEDRSWAVEVRSQGIDFKARF